MKAWAKFYDFILPELSGQPSSLLVDQKLRDAAIRLCTEGRVHRNDLDLIDVVAGEATYELETDDPQNLEVHEVREVWFNGKHLLPKTPGQLTYLYGQEWQTKTGTPDYYLCREPAVLTLVGIPDAALAAGLRVEVVFTPTLEAKGIADWVFDQYATNIVTGAKAMLMSMSKKPWTDLNMAGIYAAQFQQFIDEESFRAQRGFGRAIRAVRARFC